MRLQTVPARQGAAWVRLGFRAFGKRPIAYAALFTTVLLAFLSMKVVPLLMFVLLPLGPLVSLGFMIATRQVLDGGFPTPRVFIEPLRAPRPQLVALVQLGIVYAIATFLIMWLGDLVDSGGADTLASVAPAASAASGADAEALAVQPGALFGLMLRMGLAGLLSIPFWHAPALVYWDGHGCAKSLFSSTIACWRNRGAFAVYGLMWFGVVMALSLVSAVLLALVGQPELTLVASVPMSMIVATVYYASLYFTFADSFVASGPIPVTTTEELT